MIGENPAQSKLSEISVLHMLAAIQDWYGSFPTAEEAEAFLEVFTGL